MVDVYQLISKELVDSCDAILQPELWRRAQVS
jgi:hypothetical protein